jgi:hypothetical protein
VPGLRLTVVGSGNPAKVHVDLPEADVGTVEEVLARPGVDVVVIATPNDTHVDLARRALEAGKHVVVDKPFTLTLTATRMKAPVGSNGPASMSTPSSKSWLGEFGQGDRWRFCLTAAGMARAQERR